MTIAVPLEQYEEAIIAIAIVTAAVLIFLGGLKEKWKRRRMLAQLGLKGQ